MVRQAGAYNMEVAAPRDAQLAALDRSLLEVSGPTRAKFLHNLLSNDVEGLKPGAGRSAALMDVKGHVLALVRVLAGPSAIVLELPLAQLERVQGLLEHYRVAAPVRFKRVDAAVVALFGSSAAQLLAELGAPVPAERDAHAAGEIAGRAVQVVRAADIPAHGFVLHVATGDAEAVSAALRAAGAAAVAQDALDALRVEEGLPWFGADVTEANLLHETGLVPTHSTTKGCYVGQEVVARLDARGGNVNKLLRGLRLGAAAHAGDVVRDQDGKDVGRVTTAAVSERLGPAALAYIHRSRNQPGTALVVNDAPATVVSLPFS